MRANADVFEKGVEDWRQDWLPIIPSTSGDHFSSYASVSNSQQVRKNTRIISGNHPTCDPLSLFSNPFTPLPLPTSLTLLVFFLLNPEYASIDVSNGLFCSSCGSSSGFTSFLDIPTAWRRTQGCLPVFTVFCSRDATGPNGYHPPWWQDVVWHEKGRKSFVSDYLRGPPGHVY